MSEQQENPEWQKIISQGMKTVKEIVETEGLDTIVIRYDVVQKILEAQAEEFTKQGTGELLLKGEKIIFAFGNLRRYAAAEKFGFGEKFRENWQKATIDEKEMARLVTNWPNFVSTIVEHPPQFLLDIEQLKAGEVAELVRGFMNYATAIRKN